MDKENVVYAYNGKWFSLEKEGNSAIFDNMDERRGCYAKWNDPFTEKQIRRYSYEVSKIAKFIESKKKMVVGVGQDGYLLTKSIKFQVSKIKSLKKSYCTYSQKYVTYT